MLQSNRNRHAIARPGKPGDENAASRTVFAGKAVNSTILHAKGSSKDKIPVAAAATRRALGDVSNAIRLPAERNGKDGVVKPVRSRQASQSSVGSNQSLNAGKPSAPRPNRPLSAQASSSSLRDTSASAVASLAPRIRSISENGPLVAPGAPRIGAFTDAEAGFASQEANVDAVSSEVQGLGIALGASSDGMQVDAATEDGDDLATEGHVEESAEEADDPDNWMLLSPRQARAAEAEVAAVKEGFEEEIDQYDTTMVAEYSEEIFSYMARLEETAMANPNYMEHQTEIEWYMRATLIDWLLQVHVRYHMLPETLWIAVNIIDRFLSNRVVSLVKLQLVGVTAMFIAAKYEEIMAPSVEEFVYMTENGYTREEILKGERIILSSLEFNISSYCTPYSWVRRISKADDYDIQTRTLSKFLMEVTLLDHRFLRAKPSMIAAIGMYVARKMLGGEWDEAFVYYSGYSAVELQRPTEFLLEALVGPDFEDRFVYKKYANKKFLKAAIFARNWAKQQQSQHS